MLSSYIFDVDDDLENVGTLSKSMDSIINAIKWKPAESRD